MRGPLNQKRTEIMQMLIDQGITEDMLASRDFYLKMREMVQEGAKPLQQHFEGTLAEAAAKIDAIRAVNSIIFEI